MRVQVAAVKATTELIAQSVIFVSRQQKPHLLAKLLTTRAIARALVFTRTKHGADRVVRQLRQSGIRADAIHGDKSQSARQRTLADFKSNRTSILVATDIAARGIDVEGISHVLNFDLPQEPETYIHRIGRTGRAGASGIAVSFCDAEERKYLKAIERLIRKTLSVEKPIPLDPLPAAAAPSPQGRPTGSLSRKPAREPIAMGARGGPHSGAKPRGGLGRTRFHSKARRAGRAPSL